MVAFYNAGDQELYKKFQFLPQEAYRLSLNLPKDAAVSGPVTNQGIVATNAFTNSGGDEGGNIFAGYNDNIGAPGASPFLNMSQADFNKQLFETGPYANPYGQTLADYKRNPMIDPLNQKIVDKLRADMDAAYPNEGTADLIAKYREYNPDYNRYTDEEITQLGLKGFKPNYTDEELINMYGNQNFKDDEEEFNFMDYLPFVGNKSIMSGILSQIPQQDSRFTDIRSYYGGSDNLDSMGRIQSGLMAGYSPVSGGFLNTISGGRFGSPTTYGLQRAYQKRIDTIKKTLDRKYADGNYDDTELDERLAKLEAEKAAEQKALQTSQRAKDYQTIQDAYDKQTGGGSSYSGGETTKGDDTSYNDPFDPGGGE